MKHIGRRLLSAAALLITPPALAQDVGGAMDMTGMGIYAMEDTMREAAGEATSRSRSSLQAPVPRAQAARLTYTPSLERRRRNLAQFVAKTRAKDPEGAAKLQQLIGSTDLISAIGREIAPLGLRTNNLGDAYALWWAHAWIAAHGRNDQPGRAQLTAAKAQAARAMAATPAFASASDATRRSKRRRRRTSCTPLCWTPTPMRSRATRNSGARWRPWSLDRHARWDWT